MLPGRMLKIVLVTVQLLIPLVILHQVGTAGADFHESSDAARYRLVVTTPGTPYRDFDVPYPPLALGLFKSIGAHDLDGFTERLVLVNALFQALIVGLLFRRWGSRTGWIYLALSAPLMVIVYTRFDLVVTALAVLGAALVAGKRPRLGGLSWVVGAFVKIWPVVLIPALAARRRWDAFVLALLTGGAALVVWLGWGGSGALGQVLTAKGAHGWQFESVPGSLLRLVARDPVRFDETSGAWRLGSPPALVSALWSVALVAGVVAVWVYVRDRAVRDGVAEVAVITVALVCGTLLSAQYMIWAVPFLAIAAAAGARRLLQWGGAAVALSFLAWWSFDVNHAGDRRTELLLLGRNAALVGLLVVAILELRGAEKPATMEHGHPARARQHS